MTIPEVITRAVVALADAYALTRPVLASTFLSFAALMFASHTLIAVSIYGGFYKDDRTIWTTASTRKDEDPFDNLTSAALMVQRTWWVYFVLGSGHLAMALVQPTPKVVAAIILLASVAAMLWAVLVAIRVFRIQTSFMEKQREVYKTKAIELMRMHERALREAMPDEDEELALSDHGDFDVRPSPD